MAQQGKQHCQIKECVCILSNKCVCVCRSGRYLPCSTTDLGLSVKFRLLCDFCSCFFDQEHLKLLNLSFLCSVAGSSDRTRGNRCEDSTASANKLCYCLVRKVLPSKVAEQRWLRTTSCLLLFFLTPHTKPMTFLTPFLMARRRAKTLAKWQTQFPPELPRWGVAVWSLATASLSWFRPIKGHLGRVTDS